MPELHKCPPHCHRCPDLGGDVMPRCWGLVALQGSKRHNDLDACLCGVEMECDQEGARRLLSSRFLSPALRAELERFAGVPRGHVQPDL